MGSISTDNANRVQGRHVNIVSSSSATAKHDKSSVTSSVVKVESFENETNDFRQQNAQQKFDSSEKDRSKYQELVNDENEMNAITETLNKFMAQFNADLKITVHKDTERLVVRFVDAKSDKVLKEFPSEEYLDMIASIREYIGNLIDEKI